MASGISSPYWHRCWSIACSLSRFVSGIHQCPHHHPLPHKCPNARLRVSNFLSKFSWLPLHVLAGRGRFISCCLAGIWFDEIDRLASKWAIPNRFTGCSWLLCVDGGQLPALSLEATALVCGTQWTVSSVRIFKNSWGLRGR